MGLAGIAEPTRGVGMGKTAYLHTVALTRLRFEPTTEAYAARRTAEGKTPREIKRCLKRAIAREVYRIMQSHAQSITTTETAA
jgi:transposase